MIYHLKTSKRKRPAYLIPLIVALLALIIIGFLQIFSPRLLSGASAAIAKPILKARGLAANSLLAANSYFKSHEELEAEIEQFEAAEEARNRIVSNYKSLKEENARLRSLLGRVDDPKQTILASILSTPPFSAYDTFLVDAGEAQGVKNGSRVLSEHHTFIGKIVEVNEHTALVRLASSAGETLQVAVSSSTGAFSAEGKGGGVFEIKAPQALKISVGDPIFLPPHYNERFSVVERVEQSPADSFETLYFHLPISLGAEHFVLIENN